MAAHRVSTIAMNDSTIFSSKFSSEADNLATGSAAQNPIASISEEGQSHIVCNSANI